MSAVVSASTAPLAIPSPALGARRDLVDLMQQICSDMRADHYMLLDLAARNGQKAKILASNWIYDAIDMIGMDLIVRLACRATAAVQDGPSPDEAELFASHGHEELVGIPLRAGRKRYALLLSAESRGRMLARAVPKAELLCSYGVSTLAAHLSAEPQADLLSERERECLFWVAEGKTSEEVSVILGVSASTANSHLTSAIQKLGARNRALAVATAIRQGLI